MGRLQTKVAKCGYREYYRLLTKQCIGWVSDKGMTDEILREVATVEDIEETINDHILT